jgi:hypothetical protein
LSVESQCEIAMEKESRMEKLEYKILEWKLRERRRRKEA